MTCEARSREHVPQEIELFVIGDAVVLQNRNRQKPKNPVECSLRSGAKATGHHKDLTTNAQGMYTA